VHTDAEKSPFLKKNETGKGIVQRLAEGETFRALGRKKNSKDFLYFIEPRMDEEERGEKRIDNVSFTHGTARTSTLPTTKESNTDRNSDC